MNVVCPETVLSAELDDIIVSDVSEKLDFEVSYQNEVILMETYFPDNNGKIFIRDIETLANMYLLNVELSENIISTSGVVKFHLRFAEGEDVFEQDMSVYACYVETAGTLLADDLQLIPLTRCPVKPISKDQKEYISFYGSGNIMVSVTSIGSAQEVTSLFTLATLTGGNQTTIRRLDVSVKVISDISGISQDKVVKYSVYRVDKLAAEYKVNKYLQPQKTFVFFNSLGAQETFTCTGVPEKVMKWERTFGQIGRLQQLIDGKPEGTMTINTGYITREQTGIVEDLLNARQIAIIDEYGWHPVIIAEESFKVISRRDELINIEFKYRYGVSNHMQHRYKWTWYRIFDATFDNTFN